MSESELDVREWFEENRLVVLFGGLGVLSLVLGVRQMMAGAVPKDAVEIIPAEEVEARESEGESDEKKGEVVVDVAGAVMEPGIYHLQNGSRVGEAVAAAGGFLDEANSEFVARQINLAAVLNDGAKIYVAFEGEDAVSVGESGVGDTARVGYVAGMGVVNINTASLAELDSLWGIGEARAQAIIDNRPYGSVEEMVEKAGIPENILEKNEGKLGVN